jgi:hypothetical protein
MQTPTTPWGLHDLLVLDRSNSGDESTLRPPIIPKKYYSHVLCVLPVQK